MVHLNHFCCHWYYHRQASRQKIVEFRTVKDANSCPDSWTECSFWMLRIAGLKGIIGIRQSSKLLQHLVCLLCGFCDWLVTILIGVRTRNYAGSRWPKGVGLTLEIGGLWREAWGSKPRPIGHSICITKCASKMQLSIGSYARYVNIICI